MISLTLTIKVDIKSVHCKWIEQTELDHLNCPCYVHIFIYLCFSVRQEQMKRKRVHPHIQLIFRRCSEVFRECYHGCCVDVFVDDKNACKATWAVHASKIRVTFWDVRDRGRTKNSLRGSTVGIKFMSTIINSVASSYLTVGRHRICTYWLSGRAGLENIWLEVRVYGPSTHPARLYSVNK